MKILVVSILALITATKSQSIDIYTPTIISACIQGGTNGLYRLNMQWKFDETTDLSEIDGFSIVYSLNSELAHLYNYPDDDITGVITDGKTFANNVSFSVPNLANDVIEVLVVTQVNRIANPSSEQFTTTVCNTGEINPTNTTATTMATTTTMSSAGTTDTILFSMSIKPSISIMTILQTPKSLASISMQLSTALQTPSIFTSISRMRISTTLQTPSSLTNKATVVSSTSLSNHDNDKDDNDDSGSVAAISGALIGALLLTIFIIIIILVTIMILYRRRRKKSRRVYIVDDNGVTIHLSSTPQQRTQNTSGTKVDPVARLETVNALYIPTKVLEYIEPLPQHIHDSSGVIDCDVIITPNPSYTVGSKSVWRKECEYDYVRTDNGLVVQRDKVVRSTNPGVHNNLTDNVIMDPNPSYSILQDGRDVKLEDNPSYNKLQL